MLFQLVPGGLSYLIKQNNYNSNRKKYWDLETCRKSQKKICLYICPFLASPSCKSHVCTVCMYFFAVSLKMSKTEIPSDVKKERRIDRLWCRAQVPLHCTHRCNSEGCILKRFCPVTILRQTLLQSAPRKFILRVPSKIFEGMNKKQYANISDEPELEFSSSIRAEL